MDIIKKLINEKLNSDNLIALSDFYDEPDFKLIQLYVIQGRNNYQLQELMTYDEFMVKINYLNKNRIHKSITEKETIGWLSKATILIDHNSYLSNLKNSAIFLREKKLIEVDFEKVNQVRFEITHLLEQLKIQDNPFIRIKLIEGLVKIHNIHSSKYYDISILHFIMNSQSFKNSELSYLKTIEFGSMEEIENIIDEKLSVFGGKLYLLNDLNLSKNSLSVFIKAKNESLDNFIENFYIRFFNLLKKYSHKIENSYWERQNHSGYAITISAEKEILSSQILPEIDLKFNGNLQISIKDNSHLIIYDFLNENYTKVLGNLSTYILELKYNESVELTNELLLSYAIELYISASMKFGLKKEEFFKMTSYLSQKWYSLLISDDELADEIYPTALQVYNDFERLFDINQDIIKENFQSKIFEWNSECASFKDELATLKSNFYTLENEYEKLLITILGDFASVSKMEYAYLEAFFYKVFGLFGLSIKDKLYITYLINRMENEF